MNVKLWLPFKPQEKDVIMNQSSQIETTFLSCTFNYWKERIYDLGFNFPNSLHDIDKHVLGIHVLWNIVVLTFEDL